jgi:hypothetical protein
MVTCPVEFYQVEAASVLIRTVEPLMILMMNIKIGKQLSVIMFRPQAMRDIFRQQYTQMETIIYYTIVREIIGDCREVWLQQKGQIHAYKRVASRYKPKGYIQTTETVTVMWEET